MPKTSSERNEGPGQAAQGRLLESDRRPDEMQLSVVGQVPERLRQPRQVVGADGRS